MPRTVPMTAGPCHSPSGRHHCSSSHANLVETYRAAREAWLDAAESSTSLYRTELEEYAAANPPPTFREFLVAFRQEADVDVDQDDEGDSLYLGLSA